MGGYMFVWRVCVGGLQKHKIGNGAFRGNTAGRHVAFVYSIITHIQSALRFVQRPTGGRVVVATDVAVVVDGEKLPGLCV